MDIIEEMLPVLGPRSGQEEVEALRKIIESGWWGKGAKVAEFESKFAEMVGHKHAVAVTNASHNQDLVLTEGPNSKDILLLGGVSQLKGV